MKLNDLLKKAQRLVKEGHGDKELIFSIDDEGNEYHKVNSTLTLAKVENLKDYYLEVQGTYDPKNDEIALEDCNAIIVN